MFPDAFFHIKVSDIDEERIDVGAEDGAAAADVLR